MRKITEEDVITYYLYLVLQECKNSYKGLELEDRISEGMSALLQAVRTYNMRIPVYPDSESGNIRTPFRKHPDSDSGGIRTPLVGCLILQ
ncbi:hypothetical protein L7E55_05250 [Pelotomaculum isophthalicicum JI]|uniref:Uncharacterized protein n=1 Tax=Pelotomaculum isophthalicicum JI TaxID=947010 RepID=A0A9X4H5M9_9FIRM|nr:hypothetical protein [Pelotomaculum isophthalicicum]MDF9407769.1 hypothetical protein [Pelotomaculum isophthalicicum JI]